MSFSPEKKNSVILYLLEKIRQNDASAVRKTAENFSTTPATVYKYIDELCAEGALVKVQRGKYELVKKYSTFTLKRSRGELEREEVIFDDILMPELNDYPVNLVRMWAYIFEEMVNNIIDHSGAENVTVTIVRDFLETSVLLQDDGVGIFEKIAAHFGFSSLDEAISELFKGKLTTDPSNHSGEGIFFSSRMADAFSIVSSGKTFTHNKFDAENAQKIFDEEKPEKGTSVYITISNHTRRTASSVFDEYADVTDGFTRTSFKIINFFDGCPISRSEAKRLCNRLDSFREIELDFEGVEWIGQGFAHQLFVVFVKANPQVRVIPVNMNMDVEKMYRHVRSG